MAADKTLLPSSQEKSPGFLNLEWTRRQTKSMANTLITTITEIVTVVLFSGAVKFGSMPGGGGPAGMLSRRDMAEGMDQLSFPLSSQDQGKRRKE